MMRKAHSVPSNDPLKYMIFFTHESVIMALLSAMGAPLDYVPPVPSDLSFQLFEQKDDKGMPLYSIEVTLNGVPVFIPACQSTSCTLRDFSIASLPPTPEDKLWLS